MAENFDGIPFSDFLRLKNIAPGMIIHFQNMEECLIVGNCTPYESVSDSSDDGWDWDFWKDYKVIKVDYIVGNFLTPKQVEIMKYKKTAPYSMPNV